MRILTAAKPLARAARQRREVCGAMIGDLDIPVPFSVRGFCEAVEAHTSMPIQLHPMAVGWAPPGLCGLLAEAAGVNHIYYTEQTSVLAKATTIVHECGHILLPDHRASAGIELPPELAGTFAGPVTAVHGRTGFSEDIEATVELFASMVLAAADAGDWNTQQSSAAARLAERFG